MAHVYVYENHATTEEGTQQITYSVEVSLGISYIDTKALCTSHWKEVLAFIEEKNEKFNGHVFGDIQLWTNIHEKSHRNDLVLLVDGINQIRKM